LRGNDNKEKIIIHVKDTTKALQAIAAHHRRKFKIPVVCITGSNGKTTVKDMTWHLLSSKYNVLRNEGTKNNHIGVPQTLLKLNKEHDMCVLELGTNHKGEIALLADIARPTVAVFTNIGPSHLEFFGSLEGVFDAKKEMLGYLDKTKGLVITNGDDKFLSKIGGRKFKTVKYGFENSNDLSAQTLKHRAGNITFVVNDKMIFGLNLLGDHNIYNALAAIAVALNFGIKYKTIRQRFLDYKPTYMRLELEKVSGINILNDSYNSNPASMMRALDVVKNYPAKSRWIVSGDMLELGRQAEEFHRMIGESVASSNIDGLVTFGELSRHTHLRAKELGMKCDKLWHCSTHDEIAGLLKKNVKPGDVVLVKGSRSMRMEKVLNKFKDKD
jgi:UDP-N-acetylmuramoyl-tripeptide--D-alanyl-D-alanine ligase